MLHPTDYEIGRSADMARRPLGAQLSHVSGLGVAPCASMPFPQVEADWIAFGYAFLPSMGGTHLRPFDLGIEPSAVVFQLPVIARLAA